MNYHHSKSNPFKRIASVIGLSLGFISAPGLTQPSESTLTLVQCMDIEASLERVVCYDRVLGREATLTESVVSIEPAPSESESSELESPLAINEVVTEVTNPSTTISAEEQVELFGLAVIREDESGQSELLDTVAAIKETEPRKWLITLSSGQIWKQSIAKRYRLKEGSEIRIYQTGWGGDYRLSMVGRSGYIQVTRLK